MIIQRKEENSLKKIHKWALIYGRRKTGKTFLVRNFFKYDEYFFVKKDRTIILGEGDQPITYDAFIPLFNRLLRDGKTIVVDEFHRLGRDFMDHLHFVEKKGKLFVISSTFHLAKELVKSRSPLLGVFAEFPLGLIRIEDIARALPKNTDKKNLLETSILLSEPLVIDFYEKGMDAKGLVGTLLPASKYLVSALVGEIFNEEERKLGNVYLGILRAIASGEKISTEISSFLFSRKLIQKDNPGSIQQYLQNLIEIGLIKRVPVTNRNTYIYEHVSPLIEMFYYGDEKYNISEMEADNEHMSLVFESKFPRIVERYVRSFLARRLGLIESIYIRDDFDIDAYLMRFKKGEIAVEVKWKKNIRKEDVLRAEEVLSKVESRRKMLFVPDKDKVKYRPEGIEIVDIRDFV
jgi:hypothetical protein